MKSVSQGDIIKLDAFKNQYLVVSKNSYIRATGMFHICPILKNVKAGPVHIQIKGRAKTTGTAICDQLKLIDPRERSYTVSDSVPYDQIMEVSDVIQGIFEYGKI